MKRRQIFSALTLAFGLWPSAFPAAGSQTQPAATYEVYAVKFAQVNFGVGQLVAGADRTRRIDIAFMFWVMKTPGRVVLLDSGFYRDKFITQWKPVGYSKPSDAVA